MEDGKIVIKTDLDTKSFEEQIRQTEEKLNRLVSAYEKASNMKGKLKPNEEAMANLRKEIEKTSNSLVTLREKQENLDKPNTSNAMDLLKNMGKETERNIKKVARLVMGIVGISGAYMAVRNAMSVITSQDEQLATDIQYMKNALAYALEPIVRKIVDLMKQLMFYVGYIANAWFGVDIFKNANKSLNKATKGAKELKKQLAGFDEMNVLNDSSSGGGGGAETPSFDLTKGMQDPPAWLVWIGEHGQEIIATLLGIATALKLIDMGVPWDKAAGIGLIVAGITYSIMGLLGYLKNPTWNNFGKIIQGIGVAFIGLGIVILGMPGIVAGAIVLIVGTVIKYWDEIKGLLVKAVEWLEGSIEAVRNTFGDQVASIYETFVTMIKGVIVGFDNMFNGMKKILDGIILLVKGVFTGNWKQAWEGVKTIFTGVFETMKAKAFTIFNILSGTAKMIVQTIGYTISDLFKGIINAVLSVIESKLNTPIRAINKLLDVINAVPGINLGRLSTIKLPRLAKGGIINMPGSGVMVGSAIGGERGAEGVIPLTDSQQMALLGEAIGKYITVNANITNTMNGRVISRELQRINNESDFAYNR